MTVWLNMLVACDNTAEHMIIQLNLPKQATLLDVQEEDDNDTGDTSFNRMLATHGQNMQHRSRPLEDPEDSFAGASRG